MVTADSVKLTFNIHHTDMIDSFLGHQCSTPSHEMHHFLVIIIVAVFIPPLCMEWFRASSRVWIWISWIASICAYLQWAFFFASFKGSLAGYSTLGCQWLSGLEVPHPIFSGTESCWQKIWYDSHMFISASWCFFSLEHWVLLLYIFDTVLICGGKSL